MSAPCTAGPSSQVIAGVRAVAAECGGAEAFIGNVLAPSATILDDLRHARHAGSVHSADIARTLTYLSWLPASRLDSAGHAVVARQGQGPRRARLVPAAARPAGLRHAHPGLGASRRAKRFGTIIAAIRNGSDLQAAGSPLNLAARGDPQHRAQPARPARPQRAALQAGAAAHQRRDGRPAAGAADRRADRGARAAPASTASAAPGAAPSPTRRSASSAPRRSATWCWSARRRTTRPATSTSRRKHPIYFAPSGGPTLAINEYVRRQKQWTPVQVRERDEELMKRLQALWGFGGEGRRARASAGLELEGPPAR